MTRAFLTPVPQGDSTRQGIAAVIPTLNTDRLILRAPKLSDFETLEPIWRSERGTYMGGPFNEEDAWLDYAQAVAGWVLRGVGYWTVTSKDGTVLGFIGLGLETEDQEMEFGWMFTQEAEGHGYATEAAKAVHGYAFETLGLSTLISYVDRNNARSVAVAERLGARHDAGAVPAAYVGEDFAFRHSKGALS